MATVLEELSGGVEDRHTMVQVKLLSDEWVLGMFQKHGTQTLDQMGKLLPEMNWTQLFLAIDRLSRSKKISLWSPGFGEYQITVNGTQPSAA
jgi:hypothetical protein